MYVSFAWDNTDQDQLAIYQSLGYTGGNDIDAHPDDSGNGDSTPATVNSERRVNFESTGPYTAYYFFASDDAPYYCHVVVEVTSGVFRHFGFGTIIKVNDWTGGEYAYGHIWNQSTGAIDVPGSTQHSVGLDSNASNNADGATMHIEGVGNQGVNEKWGTFSSSSSGTDTAGENRALLFGGMRGGWWARYVSVLRPSTLNAFVPISPVPVFYRDASTTPDTMMYLGQMRHVGIVNMHNFSPGDEITVGSETWVVFPWVRKQYLEADTEESWNAGYAYRKIV
jgi:hypothetical protein